MNYMDIIEDTSISYGHRYRKLFDRWVIVKTDSTMRDAIEAAKFEAARSSLEVQIIIETQKELLKEKT